MTAVAIRDGLSPGNAAGIGIGDAPQIADPVRDLTGFRQLNEKHGWHGMIRQWLSGRIDEGILMDTASYSDELVRELLRDHEFPPGETRIVVAHDITLFPLIYRYFGRCITTIGFLNGIVIQAGPDEMDIGFEGEIYTTKVR